MTYKDNNGERVTARRIYVLIPNFNEEGHTENYRAQLDNGEWLNMDKDTGRLFEQSIRSRH